MAELAVREALAAAEKLIIELYKKFKGPTMLHDDVERAQKFLEMIHACLLDSDEFIYSELIRDCVALVYRIGDVLDEFFLRLVSDHVVDNFMRKLDSDGEDVQTTHDKYFMRKRKRDSDGEDVQTSLSSPISDEEVPDDFQTDKSLQNSDEVAKFIREWGPGQKLSTDINHIINNDTGFVRALLDSLQKDISEEGRFRSRLGDSLTLSYGELAEGDQVVGFEEHKEKLFEQLTEEDSKLLTVLVVGPGGSGKSTLVKNVFESKQVQPLFDFKAWVPVPRGPFQLNELLLKILADCEKKTPASEEKTDSKAKLRLFLQERRYMIVLDDVWRSEDLQRIVKALPNGFPGSRIIITSRNSDVASSLSPKYTHDLSSGLSLEKARDLLFKKSEGNLPPEFDSNETPKYSHDLSSGLSLEKARDHDLLFKMEFDSNEILRWCGCLPYAISEVGTLLAMKPQTAGELMKFQKDFRSEFRSGSILPTISSILQPSYTDIPNHLKTCFLYLSAFPDDYGIEAQKLIHLWIAEGFVKPKRGITEEEVAEEYLNELIARCLVLATEREINGQVRSCRVVTHVRDFILSKAENFVTVFEPNIFIDHDWYSRTRRTPGEQIRRLSIHQADQSDENRRLGKLIAGYDLKHIRTLLVFTKSRDQSLIHALDKSMKANKYLRVFDISAVHDSFWRNILENVRDSILLKYLSLQGSEIHDVPKFIWKLQFLETLNLQYKWSIRCQLPEEICQLSSLRHLLVSSTEDSSDSVVRGGVKLSAANIGVLSSIQSLSGIDVENDTIILGELQDLRKLGLVNLESKDGKELCISLEKMKHLSSLVITAKDDELLDLDHMSSPPLYLQHLCLNGLLQAFPKWISKLTSLQKVVLRRSYLNHRNPTELLEDLPNLFELHLMNYHWGEELVFRAHTFKKLMKLSIEGLLRLIKMEIAEGALPMLRELHMRYCPNLESLPEGIGGLKSLNKLVLEDMGSELVAKLQEGGEHRQMIRHIPVILFGNTHWDPFEDLSENVSRSTSVVTHDGVLVDAVTSSVMESMSKKPNPSENKGRGTRMNAMEDRPCVFTKGEGPNGRKIEGILYRYAKGEEVRIMCVCHGTFLSPAEFVKHAGGGDVTNPLRHIVVNPAATPFL